MVTEIAACIRATRKRKRWSQLDLARQLGHATPQYVSQVERGVRMPPWDMLESIASLLGLRVDVRLVRR